MIGPLFLAFLLLAPSAASALSITYLIDDRSVWVRPGGVDPEAVSYEPPTPFAPWTLSASALGAAASQSSRMDQSGMFAVLSASARQRDNGNVWSSVSSGAAQSSFVTSIMIDEAWSFSVSATDGIYVALRDELEAPLLVGEDGFDAPVDLQPGIEYSVVVFAISGLASGAGTFSMIPVAHLPEPSALMLIGLGISALAATNRPRPRPRTRRPSA